MSQFMDRMKRQARAHLLNVVFPEAEDERVLQVVSLLLQENIVRPILVGDASEICGLAKEPGIVLPESSIIDIEEDRKLGSYAKAYAGASGLPESAARKLLKSPLYYAAMTVGMNDADILIAGLQYSTAEVIMASKLFIGMQPGIETPSSLFVMRIPDYDGPEGEYLVFADCAVCPDPSPAQLADIAIATADTTREMLGWDPRVALLSFSTHGSSPHVFVDHVVDAVEIIRTKRPDIAVEGEVQADAALVENIAAKKMPEASVVAGRANVLIFPDLNAANISYKLVQVLAKADAYGPLLQGFAKPVCDLSRGASIDNIVGATVLTAARANGMQGRLLTP